jgi:toxin CptA
MFPLPLVVTISPSRALRRVVITSYLLAGGAVAVSALAPVWQAAGFLALGLSAWHYARPRPLTRLRCDREGKLAWATQAGWCELQIVPPLVALPGLTLVSMHDPVGGRRNTLLILADSIEAQDFRRLRLWLRWQAEGSSRQT